MTAYLLESSLARFKNVVCCFQTISCLLSFKEGNEWISSAACLVQLGERETEDLLVTSSNPEISYEF